MRDDRGETRHVRQHPWRVTVSGCADEIASAADLVQGQGPAGNGARWWRGLWPAMVHPIGRPGRAASSRPRRRQVPFVGAPTFAGPPDHPGGPSSTAEPVEAATVRAARIATALTAPAPQPQRPWRFRRAGDGRGPDGALDANARGLDRCHWA